MRKAVASGVGGLKGATLGVAARPGGGADGAPNGFRGLGSDSLENKRVYIPITARVCNSDNNTRF